MWHTINTRVCVYRGIIIIIIIIIITEWHKAEAGKLSFRTLQMYCPYPVLAATTYSRTVTVATRHVTIQNCMSTCLQRAGTTAGHGTGCQHVTNSHITHWTPSCCPAAPHGALSSQSVGLFVGAKAGICTNTHTLRLPLRILIWTVIGALFVCCYVILQTD